MEQVQMKDGEIRYVSSFRDFVELVDEYMGFDCKRYAEENLHDEDEIEALQYELQKHEEEISKLKDKLEAGDDK